MHEFHDDEEKQHLLARMREVMKTMFGVEDTSGVELFSTIRRLAHLSEALESQCQQPDNPDLSGPRWRLMLHLLAEEHFGERGGLTPTAISQRQRVSKNTISSLLRGLEEQGLIRRELDASDYRLFRIQLTPAGRDLIHSTAPQRLAHMNQLSASLTREEREQLIVLLEKLQDSLLRAVHNSAQPPKPEYDGG